MKHAILLFALVTIGGSSFAAPKCDTLVPIAESAYRAIDGARKMQDWATARSWATVFWQIKGSEECAVSKALGEALSLVKLGSSDVAQECKDVSTAGLVMYRKTVDMSNRPTLAPDFVTVNGVRYMIVTATGPKVSYYPKDIAKLLSDPAKKELGVHGFDPEALKKWQRLEK
jgi:hypothetical protein